MVKMEYGWSQSASGGQFAVYNRLYICTWNASIHSSRKDAGNIRIVSFCLSKFRLLVNCFAKTLTQTGTSVALRVSLGRLIDRAAGQWDI